WDTRTCGSPAGCGQCNRAGPRGTFHKGLHGDPKGGDVMTDIVRRCPECGVAWSLGRDVGGRVHTPGGLDCLHRQLVAARAEAARYRQQYEALRTGVERVARRVRDKAMDAWDAWDEG